MTPSFVFAIWCLILLLGFALVAGGHMVIAAIVFGLAALSFILALIGCITIVIGLDEIIAHIMGHRR